MRLNKMLEHKLIYLILCFFVGCLGIHRFYAGKKVTGVLYLLTFGFLGIGRFIDLILALIDVVKYCIDNDVFV